MSLWERGITGITVAPPAGNTALAAVLDTYNLTADSRRSPPSGQNRLRVVAWALGADDPPQRPLAGDIRASTIPPDATGG